ncbi:MAG: four helix bundle protein [Pirellulales bacterium]
MIIQSHKELRVWQDAMDTAMEIFETTKSFPSEEKYSLIDQIRKSSRSVATNVAEAWRKRRYEAAFVAKLSDAECEATETQTWIEFSLRCGYLSGSSAVELDARCERIIGQLVKMLANPSSWVIPRSTP